MAYSFFLLLFFCLFFFYFAFDYLSHCFLAWFLFWDISFSANQVASAWMDAAPTLIVFALTAPVSACRTCFPIFTCPSSFRRIYLFELFFSVFFSVSVSCYILPPCSFFSRLAYACYCIPLCLFLPYIITRLLFFYQPRRRSWLRFFFFLSFFLDFCFSFVFGFLLIVLFLYCKLFSHNFVFIVTFPSYSFFFFLQRLCCGWHPLAGPIRSNVIPLLHNFIGPSLYVPCRPQESVIFLSVHLDLRCPSWLREINLLT